MAVAGEQAVFDFTDQRGVLAGFWTPAYLGSALSVPGGSCSIALGEIAGVDFPGRPLLASAALSATPWGACAGPGL